MPHQSRSVEAIFGVLRSPARRAAVPILLALFAATLAACGSDQPRVPTGEPLSVVRGAARATKAAGPVTVFVAAPGEALEGRVDLAAGEGPGPVLERATEVLGLLDRADKAVPYGGQQIRGASTMRYEVTTRDGARIEAWIDVEGRARRVEVPDGPPSAAPPPTQPNGLPALVTVDFVYPGDG